KPVPAKRNAGKRPEIRGALENSMQNCSFRALILILATAGVSLSQPVTPSSAQRSASNDLPALVVLVRHGDTAPGSGSDPELTAAGAKRAQDLAATLRGTKFSAIVTTQLVRTRQTAQPLAGALGFT